MADDLTLVARRSAPRLGPGRELVPVVDGTPRRTTTAHRALAASTGGGHEPQGGGRRGRRRDGHTSVAEYLDALAGAHRVPITPVQPSGGAPPPPDRVDPTPLRVVDRLVAALSRPAAEPSDDARPEAEPEELTTVWSALVDHDPTAVTACVDVALPMRRLPGVTLDVSPEEATVAVAMLPVDDLVGPRTPVSEGTGLRLKRADASRKHQVYTRIVDSTVLAVAGTVLAVAPTAGHVTVVVLCPEHLGEPAALMVARCTRERVLPDGATRVAVDRLEDALVDPAADLVVDRGETLGALRPLGDEVAGVDAVVRAVVLR